MSGGAWGELWPCRFLLPDGRRVRLYRKGQRCRWYDEENGEQVGPEQSNVAPAIAAAFAAGWRDETFAAPPKEGSE